MIDVPPAGPLPALVLAKACECVATSSGPRAISRHVLRNGWLCMSMRLVEFACDACGKEWERWTDAPP